MPNWCNNQVIIKHPNPAEIERLAAALEEGGFCNAVIPVPKELTETISGFVGDPVEQAKLEAQTRANIEKFGHGNWYDFCVNKWGTKWDVGDQGATTVHPDGTMLETSFDSAWSPPIGVYAELVEQGFEVRAMYYEGGMCYAGIWEDGDDDFYELGSMGHREVEAMIPTDLNEMFAISETMAEYADEEELTEWINDGVEQNKKLGLIAE